MKYRIGHPDPQNWTIEEYQEGGGIISRGRFAGQIMEAKWKVPEAFYPTLKHAAMALIDKAAGDALLTGEAASILDAIKVAEARVLEALKCDACGGNGTTGGSPPGTASPCDVCGGNG